jgi:hypothetical protein
MVVNLDWKVVVNLTGFSMRRTHFKYSKNVSTKNVTHHYALRQASLLAGVLSVELL